MFKVYFAQNILGAYAYSYLNALGGDVIRRKSSPTGDPREIAVLRRITLRPRQPMMGTEYQFDRFVVKQSKFRSSLKAISIEMLIISLKATL